MQPRLTGAHALSLQTQSLQALMPVRSEQRGPARAHLLLVPCPLCPPVPEPWAVPAAPPRSVLPGFALVGSSLGMLRGEPCSILV